MALIKGTTFDDVYWSSVIEPIKTILHNEFNYGKIYISPDIKHLEPFTIRLWGTGASTQELFSSKWHKLYNIDINLYFLEKNPSETFYEQFYIDSERLYQLMFNNPTSSTGKGWWDGKVNDIAYNNFEGAEDDVDGLNKVTLDFSCISSRED